MTTEQLEQKLKDLKSQWPKFHKFMTDERRGGWEDTYYSTQPVDFQIIDLEKKLAVYLLEDSENDRSDTMYSINLGVYKDGKTKTIFDKKVYSYFAEDAGYYKSGTDFEPTKQYNQIVEAKLSGDELTILVNAGRNIHASMHEDRIDKYKVKLGSGKWEKAE
jgi:hypothetical protein